MQKYKAFYIVTSAVVIFTSLVSLTQALTYDQVLQGQTGGKVLGASTIAKVQSKTATGTTGNTLAASFTTSITSGNLLIVVAETDDGATATVTDSLGNSYSLANSVAWNFSLRKLYVYYAANSLGGSNTVTVTTSSSGGSKQLHIFEYSGVATSAPLDQSVSGISIAGNGLSITSSAVTTVQTDELLFAAGGPSSSASFTAGTGYTLQSTTNPNTGSSGAIASEDQVVSVLGSYTSTIAWSPSQGSGGIVFATFKAATSGGVADVTPPVLSAINSSALTSSSVSVGWTTDENSNSQVDYGISASYGFSSPLNSSLSTSHNVNLSSLSASTVYHYVVKSRDASGNLAVSSDQTFTTSAGSVSDTIAPSTPTNLSASAISSSQINLSWTVSTDNVGVTGYKIYRGGNQIGTSATNNYSDSGLTASTAYSYTVSSYDGAGNNSSQSSSAGATTQAGSSGGGTVGWTQLSNTKLSSVCPPGLSNCQAVVSAWSGAMADTARNRLIIWGGGHGDYNGNEVYSLNLNASPVTLTRLNNPSPVNPNPSTCPTTLSDGNPNGRHTYNGLSYLPFADKMLSFGGAVSCNNGSHYEDLWTLDLANVSWQAKDPVSGATGVQPKDFYSPVASQTAYDPNTNLVFISDINGLWSYNYNTNTYTFLNNSLNVPYDSTAVIDPVRKLLIFIGSYSNSVQYGIGGVGGASIMAVDISPGSNYAAQNWTAQSTGCSVLAGSTNPGLAYDSATGMIVGWPNFGNTVYIFDPVTKSCTPQTFAGGPPDSTDYNQVSYTTGTFGRFRYFPSLDAFALVNSALTDSFLLRLSAGGGTTSSDTTPPSAPGTPVASVVSSSQINLTWTASTDNVAVAGYKVFRNGTQIATPASNSYNDNNLTAGTTYSYTVSAYDNAGNVSSVSNSVSATTQGSVQDTTAPSTPTNLSASAISSSQINLSWTVSTDNVGVTGYKIYRGGVQIATSTLNSFSNTGLIASTAYTYTVAAYDAAANTSSQSTPASATTQGIVQISSSNTITIKESAGVSTTNYPVQIGRPFVQGEISSSQLPQAVINGASIPTQVDVKSRWADGSLKYAIISFVVPTLSANQSVTVSFGLGSTVGNTALTSAQMLDPSYNFDAQMQLTRGGTAKSASARTMLLNGDYTTWASGPIATTIILGNHNQTVTCGGKAASRYDFGFDAFCPFSPSFEATFWPATRQVYIRFIGEVTDTEQFEDVIADAVVLTTGSTNPTTVYTLPGAKSPLTIFAASRWTKEFWLNGTPSAISLNNNIAYLAASGALPNYDTSKTISSAIISSAYSNWTSKSRDLYDLGEWNYTMGNAGGQDFIGPYPSWTVRWLYSGDYRMQNEALGNADLAAAYPIHYREGNSAKFIDRAKTVSGVGRVMSISSRPKFSWQASGNGIVGGGSANSDTITPVGPFTNGAGWTPDIAHQPSAGYAEYLVTGDHFYLDESQFWAGWTASYFTNGDTTWRSRGPTGTEGCIPDRASQIVQLRGQGWGFRNRAETAWVSPDGTPEKNYFDLLTNDAIACWEGQRNITSTSNNGTAVWNFGNNAAFNLSNVTDRLWTSVDLNGADYYVGMPPLHWWDLGNTQLCDDRVNDLTVSHSCIAPWMQDYVVYGLGRAKDLGYSAGALLNWIGSNIIGQVTDPGFNPNLLTSYRVGTVKQTGPALFTSWSDAKTGFLSLVQNETDFYPGTIYQNTQFDANGNVQSAAAAVAMVANQTSGQTAWNWMVQNVEPAISGDLKWAILPRTISSTLPSVPVINSFTATPSLVPSGNASTLQWSVSNATSLSIDQGIGTVTGSISKVVTPLINTTYTLTATNAQGTVTATAVVGVTAPVAPVISNLVGSNTTATTTQLSWVTDKLSDGQIDYGTTPVYGSSSVLVDTNPMTTSHAITLTNLTPATLYHFRAKSKDANNLVSTTTDFTFTTLSLPLPPAPSISSFSALPSSITTGGSSVLSWTTANATSVSIDNAVGSVTGQTSKSVSPTQTTTYTLTASNGTATATAQTIISVGGIISTSTSPSITSFLAAPGSITAGGFSILSWVITGSPTPTVSIDNGIGTVSGLSKSVSPTQSTTYTLTATNSAGQATSQTSVVVAAAPPSGGSGGSGSAGSGGGSGSNGGTATSSPITVYIPPAAPVSGIPNPSAKLKLINSKGTYYLIISGVRHGITIPGILFSYGFALNQAKAATASDMDLPEGDILSPGDGVLVKTKSDKTVWLISNGQKHGFTSEKVFTALGFTFSQVLVVTTPELNKQGKGDNVSDSSKPHSPGINVKDVKTNTIYWIDYNYIKHPYPNLSIYNSWNVPNDFSRVLPANAADRALPVGDAIIERILN
jgi:fibronectin type 3 domain-containing protein